MNTVNYTELSTNVVQPPKNNNMTNVTLSLVSVPHKICPYSSDPSLFYIVYSGNIFKIAVVHKKIHGVPKKCTL